MLNHGMNFNLGSAKVCSPPIIKIYFSYDKYTWIAVTHYYMYLYIIVIFVLVSLLQLIHILQTFSLAVCYEGPLIVVLFQFIYML